MKYITKVTDKEGYVKTYENAYPAFYENIINIFDIKDDEVIDEIFESEIQKVEVEIKHDE